MRWSLSRLAGACAALLLAVPPATGLHESDVGVVDWHKLLVGVPLVGAPVTSPAFHPLNLDANTDNRTRTIIGRTGSVILSATANNVLAALRPDDGAVVWRHIYEPEDRVAGYYAHSNYVATLSGPGGATFRLFDATSGTLYLEKRLHAPETGHLAEPHHLGTHVAFGGAGNEEIYVLTDGHVVRRLNGKTGEVQWKWAADDQTAMAVHTNLVPTPTAVFVVGLAKSIASFTLHVTALDPQTGSVLGIQGVPSSVEDLGAYVLLSGPTQTADKKAPHIAWLEDGVLKSFKLTPKLNAKPTVVTFTAKTKSNAPYERFIDVGLVRQGHAVAVAGDGSATLLALGDSKVEGVAAFGATLKPSAKKRKKDEEEDENENTDSIWVGSSGQKDGEVILGRVYWSHVVNKAKTEMLTYTPTSGTMHNVKSAVLEIDFDTRSHGIIAHAALSQAPPGVPPSLLLTTSTGAVQLWELSPDANEKWTREEALAAIVVAEFVELPEGRPDPAKTGGRREDEGFFGRVWRHVGDAKNFPQYLSGFIRRFLTGSYASPTSAPVPASPSSSATLDAVPTRDAFGFRQLIVAATVQGKIFALDSSNGNVVWSRVLGLGWAAEVGANVLPVKMFVLGAEDTVGEDEDVEGKAPSVVLVAQRRADNTLVDTVVFHIDALTGADASRVIPNDPELQPREDPSGLLQGVDIIQGPAVEAFLLSPPPASSTTTTSQQDYAKAVLLLDEYLQVYLYPSTPRTRATLRALQPMLHFPLRTNTPSGTRVVGHALGPHPGGIKADESDEGERGYVAHSTWTLSLPPNEDVKAIIPPIRGPVASLGKVLGNRTTLYKYLNPRLFVLLTAPRATLPISGESKPEGQGQTCGLYVVDAAKGSVVYQTRLPAAVERGKGVGKEACDVKAMLVENWLVYHYYDPEWAGSGLTKGWRMVSVELYEGSGADDKTSSSDMSSHADGSVNVTTFEQAYVFPHAITALAPTTTKFGMTVKDLIVASRTHQIQSIPRRLLDPRRPNRKVTAAEQEEFLVQYEPVLASDPKRTLSHHYEVANIQRIITSPALLESTSLVFTYGLDMFLTRVAPSGTFDVLSENFNKAQLVLTVGGLALAIMFTKPMVRKKMLREKWYQ
ncbi:putative DUF1620-domain-containing protein [Lyophyllum shimeji]|uniref:ER membrane protein complex subunit 1 n=1 Tax=Lyophyllum shimeji TaxID=47721 RepID=A0A9P3PZ87_LYOSH|nr:putative DUF1620-domain-containing protein [Lyophyllum shimeji]